MILIIINFEVSKMYLNEAIVRINAIKWDEVGMKCSKTDVIFGDEYLRRLAKFFNEELIRPMPPIIANIAKLLGDVETEIVISNYCNPETIEFLDKRPYTGTIFQYYIQLAKYADKKPNTSKYLSVYEPLIKLIERGGMFVLRARDLDIIKAGYYPLGNWYERFVMMQPIDIV